ncbi:cytochrome o ubiquinol oxidase subunit IV [Rhodopila sp.]|uniref:cytochrome o ubiquinol oxidase subunit IV n=1 Tax=Rhodopila sp. TaxID=2480087 RepID=UPI003D10B567
MSKDDDYPSELRAYIVGIGSALTLSVAPFACVAWHVVPRLTLLWIIAIAAVLQIVAHFAFFLHIDLSKSKRDDLQLILFSSLIVLLMVGGTIWIISNQYARMM